MTTHGELFDEAGAAVARAAAHTSRMDTVTAAEGAHAARQHDRLMHALARHLQYLHGNALTGMVYTQEPTRRDRAALAFVTALRRNAAGAEYEREHEAEAEGPAARALSEAVDAIRLATDVLATHHRPGRGGRTPDAQAVEDPKERWGVTVRAADLAYTSALTRSRLIGRLTPGHRVGETSQVANEAELINAARDAMTTAADTGPGSKGILELGPFSAPLPRANPLAPAATALQYARAETHQLSVDRRLGVGVLRDLTLLGLSIAQHSDAITRAAAVQTGVHMRGGRARATAATLTPAADYARELARRWRNLYGQLGSLRSPHPPQAGLAHAALAVRAALEPHTRRNGRWATPDEMHPTRKQMEELLTGIRAIALPLDEFAAAGRHSLATLHRRGQLYIDARLLPASPELLHAQRTGRYVTLPAGEAEQLAESWRETAEASRDLTTVLAASSGLVGQHPRSAAALARTNGPTTSDTGHAQQDTAMPSMKRESDTPPTGEANNIEAAREALRAVAATADRASSAIDNLSVSLNEACLDAASLDAVAGILEAADHLKSAANRALSGMNRRHAVLEDAVNASRRTPPTRFYRR